MTTADAIKILKAHSIGFGWQEGRLMMLECSTTDCAPGCRWVECPETRTELYAWLGY